MPLPYSPNWSRKSTSTGYVVVHCPDHPRAWSTGYVYEHVLLMEQRLDRLLEKGEIVHHKDENRKNNSIDNLELTNRVLHGKHHAKPPTFVDLKCDYCGIAFKRQKGDEPAAKGYRYACCSKQCVGYLTSSLLKGYSASLLKR